MQAYGLLQRRSSANLIGFFPQGVNQTFFSAAALFAGRGKEKIKKALPLKDIDGKANNKSTYKAPDGVRPDWWTGVDPLWWTPAD